MSRITEAFANGKAFIPFITAGYPDLETTRRVILEAQEAGADLIEIGIPFSDPTAEGPVIQNANVCALKGGVTTDKIFEMVKKMQDGGEVTVPLVFMTYANVVYAFHMHGSGPASEDTAGGIRLFCAGCRESGADGLILPDVPFEEKDEFDAVCKEYDLELISLIAPTSENRIKMIAAKAGGFIYVVSSLGVTGVRRDITTDISAITAKIREVTSVPCAVGFGISTPQQAKRMSDQSDGVIVGSAIIRLIEKYGRNAAPQVGEYIRQMKSALRE